MATSAPNRFLTLTDATVHHLAKALTPDAWSALQTRPWMHRVDGTAILKTLPSCPTCGTETGILHKFCCSCGSSTAGRRGVVVDGGPTLAAPE